MNPLDLFRSKSDTLPIANRREIVSRYQKLRAVSRNLHNEMITRLSTDVLHEGGRKLGILRNGTFVLNSEDESAVLMDYCLHDVRRKGCNAIEQYLIDSPPDAESAEMTCLRAMQHAFYSLFVVESVERGLGVTMRDLLSNEILLVVDLGFGSSAKPGLVVASRMLRLDGFNMTGGAALPVAVVPKDARDALAKQFLSATAPDNDGYWDPAPLIRACLQKGCSSRVRYQEPSGQVIGPRRLSSDVRSATVGRNAPCPCGSGKKFKHCCLKK
jgi:hypothetical protein